LNLSNKKILIVADFLFPDGFGGANKVAYYTARGLRAAGADVRLLVRSATPELPEWGHIDGMPTFRWPLQRKTALHYVLSVRGKIRHSLQRLARNPDGPFDGVVAHQPLTAGAILGHSMVRNATWIYNFHSPWDEEYLLKARCNGAGNRKLLQMNAAVRRIAEAGVIKRCPKIVVLSRYMQARLEAIHGLGARSLIIPGGVDTHFFRPASDRSAVRKRLGWSRDRLVLLTVRNLRPRTGVANLIRAAGNLRSLSGRFEIVIAGSGSMEGQLKQMVADRSLERIVSFAGRLPEEKLAACYRAADIFVLPTEALEGFGMATVEALASGLPVIGTPVGATPEILSLVGGEWLTRDSSPAALSDKISERIGWISENPGAYETLRRQCRELSEAHFSWEKILPRWQACCGAAIAEGRSAASKCYA
jgi:glycosyltransferase involved in cell wall biosynthesis